MNVTPVQAQRGKTFELGTRGDRQQQWGRLAWDDSVYHAIIRNELLALNGANGLSLGTTNAGKTMHQGIEVGAEAIVGHAWTLRASYMLNDFRFRDDAVYGNNRLAGVPRQVAVGEVLYKLDNGIYFGPNVKLASATYIDHANTLEGSGYGVVGFKLGQQVSKQLLWFIDCRNLADKVYAGTTGVTADTGGTDGRYFFPGDGRSVYAGVELKY